MHNQEFTMDITMRKLMCRQLDKKLKPLCSFSVPQQGWVRVLRNALGISSGTLARWCGVSQQRIIRIEQDEIAKKTTLRTLEEVAEKLNCRFIYAFVPNQDLFSMLEKQAKKQAIQHLNFTAHSMILEDQRVSKKASNEQVALLTEDIMKKDIRNIWK
jgi:predicted DNA-binding mobile mystery protein A